MEVCGTLQQVGDTAAAFWLEEIGVGDLTRRKTNAKSYIERFNGSFRRDILDAHWFKTLDEVRERAENWRIDYNMKRPHDALNNLSPIAFAAHISSKI